MFMTRITQTLYARDHAMGARDVRIGIVYVFVKFQRKTRRDHSTNYCTSYCTNLSIINVKNSERIFAICFFRWLCLTSNQLVH